MAKKFFDTKYGRTDVFEIVTLEELPDNYFVWNIGRRNFPHPNFVPFAKEAAVKYHVDLNTLKCVEIPEQKALKILKNASMHGMTKADVIEFLNTSVQ